MFCIFAFPEQKEFALDFWLQKGILFRRKTETLLFHCFLKYFLLRNWVLGLVKNITFMRFKYLIAAAF